MKTKWTLLLALVGAWNGPAAVTPAQAADLRPMVVRDVTGTLLIQQSLPFPCGGFEQTTTVSHGRIEIAPAEGASVAGATLFMLTRANVSFTPFVVHGSCLGREETRDYRELTVELSQGARFAAVASGPGVFTFTIPEADLLLREIASVNGSLEEGYQNPKEPVTGTIDLEHGTVQMRVVGASRINAGLLGNFDGSLIASLSGSIAFPDADGDGVPDRTDNCRLVANADQAAVASPIVKAPLDVTLASCLDRRIGPATAADLCQGGPVTVTNDAPVPLLRGAALVTWRAQDARGQIGTDVQTVTVVDRTSPSFTSVPPAVGLTNCGPADLGLPTGTDDCGGAVTFTNDAPASFGAGSTTITWMASDLSGNHATATQTVTVTDTVAPSVSCVPAGPPGGTFRVAGSDACAPPTLRLGTFVLADGERIKINEVGQSGIRLVNLIGPEQIKHFHVGRGEAVITVTDPSGNVASVSCLP